VLLAAREGEPLCGAATLVEQLASTRGCAVERALAGADSVEEFVADLGDDAVVFLVSDEHGVVVETGAAGRAAELAQFLSQGIAKLFA